MLLPNLAGKAAIAERARANITVDVRTGGDRHSGKDALETAQDDSEKYASNSSHRVRDRRCDTQDRIWHGRRDDCGRHPSPEGFIVIGPSGAVKVMIATKPVDF
ncbi:hypothetical protein [Rhizobium johnstonii]|uniref:hypothetical protein n=1 Tax=Rhizobium johnstonii TaxID=3019933 RepID=UPI003F9E22D7